MQVMAEPEQSLSGVTTMLVEEIGSQSLEKKEQSIPHSDDMIIDIIPSSSESLAASLTLERSGCKEKKTIKDEKEFLKQVNLKFKTRIKIIDSSDATDEEKERKRQRLWNEETIRWRFIFSKWPRDPNSLADISSLNQQQHWGATLFDFYSVKLLVPESQHRTFSSGRNLAAWMKANGEDYAKDQLEFAENEEDPYLIHPYEITGLIQDTDQSMDGKKGWIRDEKNKDVVEESESKIEEREYWKVPQPVRLSIILFYVHILTPTLSSGLLRPHLIPLRIQNHGQMNRSLENTQSLRNTSCILACPQFLKFTTQATNYISEILKTALSGTKMETLSVLTDWRPQPQTQLAGRKTISSLRQRKQGGRLFTMHSLSIRIQGTKLRVVLYFLQTQRPTTENLVLPNR